MLAQGREHFRSPDRSPARYRLRDRRHPHADLSEVSHPGETGCTYADQELLPAMRQYGRFIDQEAFDSA
jgi:hypothetical protein